MRKFALKAWLSLVLVPLSAFQVSAASWTIDTAHSSAQFSVRHMMVSTVRGEFTKLTGAVDLDDNDLTSSRVEATIDMNTVDTREPKRDAHLKSPDFFDAANFPTATFKSTRVEKAGSGFKVTGDLTLRGVTKPVVLEVDALSAQIKDQGGNLRTGTSARFKINRKDFGVNWSRTLDSGGLVVSDEVSVNIDVELVQRKQQ
jgi:polyisoprenoid-binding protein YceI